MFTGLIEDVGHVAQLLPSGAAARLLIVTHLPTAEIRRGDSLAINGVCLTVVAVDAERLSFDISPESRQSAAFDHLSAGSPVNIERALRLGDRIGGHLVSGHVDCVGTISERRERSSHTVFSFLMPEMQMRYLAPKGSIAVDGISLTVNEVRSNGFSVNVIPHTLQATNLQRRTMGDSVNIETDILAKYVERLLLPGERTATGGLTLETLAKAGFLS
jgi:riboflavin synthase